MAPKKPTPRPTHKVATPWLSPKATPKPTATPKPMKSPKPPKDEPIPSYIPQWQKDILRQQYYDKYKEYLDKKKEWMRQQGNKK